MFTNGVSELAVQKAFEGVLFALDALGREPDRWEQATLVDALCSMAGDRYIEAATRIVEIRLSLLKRPTGGATAGKTAVTKEAIRRALSHIRIHHACDTLHEGGADEAMTRSQPERSQ